MRARAIFFIILAGTLTSGLAARGAAPTLADVPADASPELRKLIEMTFSPKARTRGEAAKGLGAMGSAAGAAVPFLVHLLSDNADTHESGYGPLPVGIHAQMALEKIGKPAVGPCIAALKGASQANRMAIIGILGRIGEPEALDVVIPLINDLDAGTSHWAIMSLWQCKDPRIVAPLAEALGKSRDRRVRQAAAAGLANVRDPRAVDALLAAMKDEDLTVRDTAIISLGDQKDQRAVTQLLEVLQQPGRGSADDYARRAAASALGKLRDSRAFGPLLALLDDRSEPDYPRSAAAIALALIGNRDALPHLTKVLKETGEPATLRAEAVHAIAKLDGKASLPLLTRVAESSRDAGEVRFWAALEVLTITDGAIEDIDILPALTVVYKGFELDDAHQRRLEQTEAALKQVVARGKSDAVRSAAAKMLERAKAEDKERDKER